MNLLICFLCLFCIEIHAKDDDHNAGSVILKVNSLLSEMIQTDNLETYRRLSKQALTITQDFFKYAKETEVITDVDSFKKVSDTRATNKTERKDKAKASKRRTSHDETKDSLCKTLLNNVEVALKLVQLNLDEFALRPQCYAMTVRGGQNDLTMIQEALNKWLEQRPDTKENFWPLINSGKTNLDLKSEFILLALTLSPYFTPTPTQIYKLESILKRPVFGKLLHSKPSLCLVTEANPQSISFLENLQINHATPISNEIKHQQYFVSQRPIGTSQKLISGSMYPNDDSYSKHPKIVKLPDSVYEIQKPKPKLPLVLNAKPIPQIALNKILSIVPKTELTSSQFVNGPPILSSTPVTKQLFQVLNNPDFYFKESNKKYSMQVPNISNNMNAGLPQLPVKYPKSVTMITPNELPKLKLVLEQQGQTPKVKLPLKLHAIPYTTKIDYPIPKKPHLAPPPLYMNAKPVSSNEISRLLKKKSLGGTIPSVSYKDVSLPKEPLDKKNPIHQTPQQKYNININGPQMTNYQDYYPINKIKYPYVSPKPKIFNLYKDLQKPNLMVQNIEKETKPLDVMYHNNPQKLPEYDLVINKKYSDYLLPEKDNEFLHVNSFKPETLKLQNQALQNPFSEKKDSWFSQPQAVLEHIQKNKLPPKTPMPMLLYGADGGNRDDLFYPIKTHHDYKMFTETPTVGSLLYDKPVSLKNENPINPFLIEKGFIDYGSDKLNNNDEHKDKLPYLSDKWNNQKVPSHQNIPLIPNNIHKLYSNPMEAKNQDITSYLSNTDFFQRPQKYPKDLDSEGKNVGQTYLYDQIINPEYKNKVDNTKPWPYSITQHELSYDTPTISEIDLKLTTSHPLELYLAQGHLKPTNQKWHEITAPIYWGSQTVGLQNSNKHFEPITHYHQNPFKKSYQIDDWLKKTPLELLQSGDETNLIKLATSKLSPTEIELIFLMKAQEPIIYWPVYYLSYRIPTTTIINKIKSTPINKPIITSTNYLLQELINSQPYSAISPELKSLQTRDLWRLLVNNGLVVAANIYKNNQKINDEDYLITLDKIIKGPGNQGEFQSKYLRTGPLRSEDSSNIRIDQSDEMLNSKVDEARRLLARYFYAKRFNYGPSKFSRPKLFYKQKVQKNRQALQKLQQFQRLRNAGLNLLLSRQKAEVSKNQLVNTTSESPEINGNLTLKISIKDKSIEPKVQNINITFRSTNKSSNVEAKVGGLQKTVRERVETTTISKPQSNEVLLTVKGLREKEETPIQRFDIDLKNNTEKPVLRTRSEVRQRDIKNTEKKVNINKINDLIHNVEVPNAKTR